MGALINLDDYRGFACETSPVWTSSRQDLFQRTGFCDWVSIYQRHFTPVKKFSAGAIITVDEHGEIVSMVLKRERFEGSHESAVMLRSDGETVWFDGNVSKFNRKDNVFGFTFAECLRRINEICDMVGLPHFTEGERYLSNVNGNPGMRWTGAKVTRLDITENFATGSRDNASHFMRFLQEQQASRLKTGTYGDEETVDYGRGSRHVYFKLYNKAKEIRRHALKTKNADDEYLNRLADWCDDVGLVRAELTLKARKLRDIGCDYLGGFNMKHAEQEFVDKCGVFTRADAQVDDLPKLPASVLGTLRMWENGDDVSGKLSRATFYRHRSALLPHGVDIAIKSSTTRLKMRTRVIKLGPVAIPSWYELNSKGYGT